MGQGEGEEIMKSEFSLEQDRKDTAAPKNLSFTNHRKVN